MNRWLRFAVAAGAALLLAGCKGGESAAPEPTPAADAEAPKEEAAPGRSTATPPPPQPQRRERAGIETALPTEAERAGEGSDARSESADE